MSLLLPGKMKCSLTKHKSDLLGPFYGADLKPISTHQYGVREIPVDSADYVPKRPCPGINKPTSVQVGLSGSVLYDEKSLAAEQAEFDDLLPFLKRCNTALLHVHGEDRIAGTRNGNPSLDLQLIERAEVADLASLLKRHSKAQALTDGRKAHAYITKCGHDRNTFLCNCLAEMYGNCGSKEDARCVFENISEPNLYSWNILIKTFVQNGNLEDARNAFDRMPHRDIVSWNTMIAAFANNGQCKMALVTFHQMQCGNKDIKLDKASFVSALDACASLAALEEGQKIHTAILENGYEQDVVIITALVNLYGKCRRLANALALFAKMPARDVVACNSMIAALAQNGYCTKALDLFHGMQLEGIKPNKITFVSALDAATHLEALEVGQEIYKALIDLGYEQDMVLETALINMFGKCGNLQNARYIFGKMARRNTISCNAMISAFSQNGHCNEALDVFSQMQQEGIKPSQISFICVLNACASLSDLEQGLEIHAKIIGSGFEQDVYVGNSLVHMYGKSMSLLNARNVFGRMQNRDIASWNAMIAALAQNGHDKEAMDLFFQMQINGLMPGLIAFVCLLEACSSVGFLEEGKNAHSAIIRNGWERNICVGTTLINMYGIYGNPCDACAIFDRIPRLHVFSWNAMISAFAHNGYCKEALDLFYQMQIEGIKPDEITITCFLGACAKLAAVKEGQEIYAAAVGLGYEQDVAVGTAVVHMYGKCGSLCSATHVFDRITSGNIISWNALISVFT